ncbi:Molybdopterin-synthase adenylyltransferase [invertebrate metagenome]|uniref:Molybdopterin-synthase adenylyltransferase n=1 Tax=invertebrate metagenome TaxID=1711999 RepID=A0A2H9T9C1_9ZZZZ
MMNDNQLLRYSRQIMLPDVDIGGQEKLLDASVLVIGLGGLGCPVSTYLAEAGVGHLLLADYDAIDLANLQRQILFTTDDIGHNKASVAVDRLQRINPTIQLEVITHSMNESELLACMEQVDIVVDATDNIDSRFLINRCSVRTKTPLVCGAAVGFGGQLMVFDRRMNSSPCYHCLYRDAEQTALTCSTSGIIGPVVGVIGAMQALETIRLIVGFGQSCSGKLLVFDGMDWRWQVMVLPADPQCPVCSHVL